MPLFTSHKDSGFLKGINKELIHGIISIEVGFFKLQLDQTEMNIYEESERKAYKTPVRIFALLEPSSKQSVDDDFGVNFEKTLRVGFIKSDLKEKNVYVEPGDILDYDGAYYEIDQVSNSKYWSGRNPNTLLGITEDQWDLHGYDLSVVVDCHVTDGTNLHIENLRTGINEVPNKSSIPKFL